MEDFVVVSSVANNPTQEPMDATLSAAEWHTCKQFYPQLQRGKVIKVYDGDTITVAAFAHSHVFSPPEVFRFAVRLLGIDAPEKSTHHAEEKRLALESQAALSNLIMNKIVRLHTHGVDKYGRLLCDVFVDNSENGLGEGETHLNEWMLASKYAVAYDGGTKHRPSEWEA